ncbi:unnamed protein product [Fraxinus pennsylvanica]|uniref:Protein ENHANCED DISEASE RESISTANCE 2 C-terminal domain-containing protein n=1 Tax=Fraxinus pennsylvanica TaxID=56036 RepID=A0AAD1Z4N9_9LAMI|nr:unnamed protein product [Fraxinus pennsylvanica]
MPNLEENQEHGWIEKVKSEGSVPLLEPDHWPNGWASSGDVFKYYCIFCGYGTNPRGLSDGSVPKRDDGFRNSRLKLIANIVKGPWIVRKAVGEQAICIIGRSVTCKYYLGENFIEVDIDIGSSVVANAIVHLAFGYITTLTVDLAFLMEGQTESELPERILGAVRFSELNTASARQVELHSEKSMEFLRLSLQTRFWKSLGQGFSQLIKPGGQESESNSHTAHVNGDVDHKSNDADVDKL